MNVGNRSPEAIIFNGRGPPMLCCELSSDCSNGPSGSELCYRLRPNVNNKWRRLPGRWLRVNKCDVNSQIRCKNAKKHTFRNLFPLKWRLKHPKSEFISEFCLRAPEPLPGDREQPTWLMPNEFVMESPSWTLWITNKCTCRVPTTMISAKIFHSN